MTSEMASTVNEASDLGFIFGEAEEAPSSVAVADSEASLDPLPPPAPGAALLGPAPARPFAAREFVFGPVFFTMAASTAPAPATRGDILLPPRLPPSLTGSGHLPLPESQLRVRRRLWRSKKLPASVESSPSGRQLREPHLRSTKALPTIEEEKAMSSNPALKRFGDQAKAVETKTTTDYVANGKVEVLSKREASDGAKPESDDRAEKDAKPPNPFANVQLTVPESSGFGVAAEKKEDDVGRTPAISAPAAAARGGFPFGSTVGPALAPTVASDSAVSDESRAPDPPASFVADAQDIAQDEASPAVAGGFFAPAGGRGFSFASGGPPDAEVAGGFFLRRAPARAAKTGPAPGGVRTETGVVVTTEEENSTVVQGGTRDFAFCVTFAR